MFGKLLQLFRLYARRHLFVEIAGFDLVDGRGGMIGHLDELRISRGRLFVEGWVNADRVSLVTDKQRTEGRPCLLRQDVATSGAADGGMHLGFKLEQRFEQGDTAFCAETDSACYIYQIPLPGRTVLRLRKLQTLPGFLVALMRAAPSALHWYRTGDLAARTSIKRIMGLTDLTAEAAELPEGLFLDNPPEPGGPADTEEVTLILPVYNAFELLPEVLDRIERNTNLPWHLIIVEDCSGDPEVRPFLRSWAADPMRGADRVTLLENTQNLGFVKSVNRAFEVALARGQHVILLNSDVFVPADWASRLIHPIRSGSKVASVTPISNDAEIFSAPVICRKGQVTPDEADRLDMVARQLHPDISLAEAPTGVGFCMAINIDYLSRLPSFDSGFGRGYGEEVDWCQRARALGGQNLGLGGLFVEHRGGTSFGTATKQKLVARNNAIISARYPDYDAEVQSFIRNDPMAGPRLALALALAAERQSGAMPLYLAHSMGGGAEKYLEDQIAGEIAAEGCAVVLRTGGARRWRLELHQASGITCGRTDDFELIQRLLQPVETRRIVYSCGVGHPDPVTLPERLLALRRHPADRIEVLFHDFFPLSPSFTLLDGDGSFTGVPDVDSPDRAHQSVRPDGRRVTLADWRRAWGELLATADELVVFSEDSTAHVRAAYPQVGTSLIVRPHRILVDVPRIKAKPRVGNVIGILGNIGLHKGAGVVADLARALAGSGAAELVLVGNIDPRYALPASVTVHGDYDVAEIPFLVERYGITHWLIPSIWPETFSFTTHEALATGLPVMCFDLGAQAEAVRPAPQGQVIALRPGHDPAKAVLERLAQMLDDVA